jgi:hypothetical protein
MEKFGDGGVRLRLGIKRGGGWSPGPLWLVPVLYLMVGRSRCHARGLSPLVVGHFVITTFVPMIGWVLPGDAAAHRYDRGVMTITPATDATL